MSSISASPPCSVPSALSSALRHALLVACAPDATLERSSQSMIVARAPGARATIASDDGAVIATLLALYGSARTHDALYAPVAPHRWPELAAHLRTLDALGALCHALHVDGAPALDLYCLAPGAPLDVGVRALPDHVRLSRFALAHAERGELVMESATSRCRVVMHDVSLAAAALACASAVPSRAFAADASRASDTVHALALALLLAAGVVVPCDVSGAAHEDDDPLRDWSLHDALFHARTRWGLRAAPATVLSPRGDELPPAARARDGNADVVHLPTPTHTLDGSLDHALAGRRSVRVHTEPPLTLDALGALLHWSARVQRTLPASVPSQPYDATLRPYPSGGACHPLVIYACVPRCDGLDSGLYRYDPFAHALERLRGRDGAAAEMLAAHPDIDDLHGPRQILLVIAARFARTNRRYREVAYALVMKEAGALLQNLYVVAGALGLAACALGSGDASALAAAVGVDVWEESSIAELSVGAGG